MKIVELFLDDNEESGIEAISIVESPAIESDFIALKSDEIKLAEIDKEKKILMGALLIPNKPIYRKTEGDEYYIYFSRETVLKASQRYLMNGYQGNSTLEHSDNLQGLTLVESWIVEDEVQDKSRKYDMNVPIGTWMGTVKVNNEEVWNNYVKTGKVKGFSIEGFFADKIKASKMNKEQEADLLLSKITSIIKGERVQLNKITDLVNWAKGGDSDPFTDLAKLTNYAENIEKNLFKLMQSVEEKQKESNSLRSMAKELGADSLINDLNKADDLLKLKIKNIRDSIRIAQQAQKQP
jgi:hypothetical protein